MMESERSNAERQALEALLAITGSEYFLRDDLQLFRGQEVDWWHPLIDVFTWCMDELLAGEGNEGVSEEFADIVTEEVFGRVQAMVAEESGRSAEALYLRALVLIVDDFCAISGHLGRSCETTPIPKLRGALIESLRQDCRLNPAASGHAWRTVLDGADDLAKQWHSWATQPHPLLAYTRDMGI